MVRGWVREVLHQDPGTGFAVVRLRVDSGELVRAVGPLAGLAPGEDITLIGDWREHPRWGRQFVSRDLSRHLPDSVEGVRRFLGGGLVRGVGPRVADRLLAAFGTRTLAVIEHEPHELARVRGLGPRRREALICAVTRARGLRDLAVFLGEHGLGGALVQRLWDELGPCALSLLRNDPYELSRHVRGIGFTRADAMARQLGVAAGSPARLRAALVHALATAQETGHAFLPRRDLVRRVHALIGAAPAAVEPAVAALAQRGDAVLEPARDDVRVYAPDLHHVEVEAAQRLAALAAAPARLARARPPTTDGLDPGQQQALALLARSNVAVITGPPGTGKTTVVRALHRWLTRERCRVVLAAPTGRAARRLAEVVGAPASTLHRLLALGRDGPAAEATTSLPADVVVVDETSMVDLPLLGALVRQLPPGKLLVLVGDEDQLPSIGPGAVLADVIASGAVPVARLTRIFRQGPGSGIVRAADRIRRGLDPLGPDTSPEVVFDACPDPEAAARRLADHAADERVQVLSPINRGPAGVRQLNELVRARLHPDAAPLGFGSGSLHAGDRVIHLSNDYRRELFNGDAGRLVAVDRRRRCAIVEFGGRNIMFREKELAALAPAFALSVHKAQGSEYPVIAMPVLPAHAFMLRRNLLYTAVTRARERVLLVGTHAALALAVRSDRVGRRHTALAERLQRAGLTGSRTLREHAQQEVS